MGCSTSRSAGTPPPSAAQQPTSSSPADTNDPRVNDASIPDGEPKNYTFPTSRLTLQPADPAKTPLVLVACGSFSPITTLHLQLFELAQRYVAQHPECGFEIVGNYMSPCSDDYGKSSLVSARHRIEMCKLAIAERNSNIMIDEWEAVRRDAQGHPLYTPTSAVLQRLDDKINSIPTPSGKPLNARIMLLIGADLALTMSDHRVWPTADLDILLGHYGAFIVERPNQCAIKDALEPLQKYKQNLFVVPSFENDVSSTKIRAQIRNGESALDLPKVVYEYIVREGLYQENGLKDDTSSTPKSKVSGDIDEKSKGTTDPHTVSVAAGQ